MDPPADEIIVADQSDPEQAEQVRSLCRPPIRYLPVERRGLGFSRQSVLCSVHCEILAFTDDDCRVRADWLGAIRESFLDHPEVSGVTGAVRPDPDEPLPPSVPASVSDWGGPDRRLFDTPVDPIQIGSGLNMAFRSEALRAVGGFDPMLGVGGPLDSAEDADIFHRLLLSNRSILYEPRAVVSHHPPRDLGLHEHNDHLYARGLGAWAAWRWRQGDRLPSVYWLRSFFRNLYYLFRHAPWESLRRKRHRFSVGRHLIAGWLRGARAGRAEGTERP
jgi:cellulose synthase/poly-beta-1,6-N-acetylglucosamine synthase-like glycosyltransferase